MSRALPFLLLFLALACTPQPSRDSQSSAAAPGGQSQDQGRLRIGMRRAPDSFNPYVSTQVEGEIIGARLFPTLFQEQPYFENGLPALTPRLVREFRWDRSGKILDLWLKPDLTWSDGVALTSADIAYTLTIQKDPQVAWLSADIKNDILSWQVVAEDCIQIVFGVASPFNLLNLNEGFIVPRHGFEQIALSDWAARDWSHDLVVFGPYRIEHYSPGENLVLAGLDPAATPSIGLAFIRDNQTLYQLLLGKELDYAWPLPLERMEEIKTQLAHVIYDDLTFSFLGWNPIAADAFAAAPAKTNAELEALLARSPHPLFGDVRVRRALELALPRSRYLTRFWEGSSRIPVSPFSAGLKYFESGEEAHGHDVEAAERLLDEAGWLRSGDLRQNDGRVFRFAVICNAGNALREQYLLAIREDLAKIGIEMTIDVQEPSRYLANCRERRFDAMIGSFRTGTRPDLSSLFGTGAALEDGANFCSWVGLDEALAAARNAPSQEALRAALLNLEARFLADQPMTMLFCGQHLGAVARPGMRPKSNYLDPLFGVESWLAP